MLFILVDDGTLHVFDNPADVHGYIEPVDVDSVIQAIVDDHGQRYQVKWMDPPPVRRFLWAFKYRDKLAYEFERDGSADLHRAREILKDATDLYPNKRFKSLSEVHAFLAAK